MRGRTYKGNCTGKGGPELGPSSAQSRSRHGVVEVGAACVGKSSLRNPLGSSSWTEHLGFSPSSKRKQSCLIEQTHTPLVSGDEARGSEQWLGRRVHSKGRVTFQLKPPPSVPSANCHRKEMRRCREGENEAGATVHPPVSLRGGARGSPSDPWRCHFTATSAQGNANS